MRIFVEKILHWISIIILYIVLLLAVLLTAFKFSTPYFQKYCHNLETYVGEQMQVPVQINSFALGSRGLEPVLRLNDVVIFNDKKTKKIIKISQLQIGVDVLGSLIRWQIEPGLLSINGADATFFRGQDGKLKVLGIKTPASDSSSEEVIDFDEAVGWLFAQGKIELSNINIVWRNPDGSSIKFNNVYSRLFNGALQHGFLLSGNVSQNNRPPIIFDANLTLQGDLLKHAISSVNGSINISNWALDFNTSSNSDFMSLLPEHGDINFTGKSLQVTLTKVFRKVLVADALKGEVTWNHIPDGLEITGSNIKIQNSQLSTTGKLKVLLPASAEASPQVDLLFKYKFATLANLQGYYPVNVFSPGLTAWLDKAVISSDSATGTFILKGALKDFPYADGGGHFLIATDLNDVTLNYQDGWPYIYGIDGKMIFENRSMTITATDGEIVGATLESAKVTIPNLAKAVLNIDGSVNDDSSNGLRFIYASPLKNTLGRRLQGMSLSGPMQLALKLAIPLEKDSQDSSSIVGDINLQSNKLLHKTWGFALSNLSGKLNFTDHDLTGVNLHGELLGKPITLYIDTVNTDPNDTITQVHVSGNVDINSLQQSAYWSGNLDYKVLLQLHSNSAVDDAFKLNSTLQNIVINLPAPLGKAVNIARPLTLEGRAMQKSNTMQISVHYGSQLSGTLDLQKFSGDVWRIIAADLQIGVVDYADWKKYFIGGKNNLHEIKINFDALKIYGQEFKKLALYAVFENNDLKVNFDSEKILGSVVIPKVLVNDRMKIRLQKLFWEEGKQNFSTLMPSDIPSMDLLIDDFHYGNKRFGRVELDTWSKAKELNIVRLLVDEDILHLAVAGNWVVSNGKQQSNIYGSVKSNNFGALLKHWDLTESLAGGKGEIEFVLHWLGAIYQPSLANLNGGVRVNVVDGRIINLSEQTNAELGFGRVLNLLSLQSLPRFLTLDFSDVTKNGFSFNTLTGDIKLQDGNAVTYNTDLSGSVAEVVASGRIGLGAKDYDVKLSVTPHLTSSIPVIAAIAGGPIVGAVTWAADEAIGAGLKHVNMYVYKVTGSWLDPMIIKQ